MRVTFVVPELNLAGGSRIILQYATYLSSHGHQVTIIHPSPARPSLRARLRTFARRLRAGERRPPRSTASTDFDCGDGRVRIVRSPSRGTLAPGDLPDGDVLIATWWATAEWIARGDPSKGHKVYLIQDHEVFPYLPVERVRNTYRLPMTRITVSRWLQQELAALYGASSHLVENGVDLDRFRNLHPPQGHTVGFVWTSVPRKNSTMLVEAVRLARSRLPELRAVVFGSEPCPVAMADLAWVEYRHRPDQADLADIYSTADIWLFSSLTEGFGLPVLEALACGTPVIATPAGAAPDLIDGSNGWLIPPTPVAMAEAIERFLRMDPEARAAMADAARAKAVRYDGRAAADRFEAVLHDLVAGGDGDDTPAGAPRFAPHSGASD